MLLLLKSGLFSIVFTKVPLQRILSLFFMPSAAGLVQPAEDRPGDGQDDDPEQGVGVPAAGHGETQTFGLVQC